MIGNSSNFLNSKFNKTELQAQYISDWMEYNKLAILNRQLAPFHKILIRTIVL